MHPILKKNIKLFTNNFISLFPENFLTRKYLHSHTVLMFHRVNPMFNFNNLDPNYSLGITPYLFDEIIKYLSENYNIVPIDNILDLKLRKKDQIKLIITFDDGYKDNFDYAFPILKKYNVPAVVYISTRFIDGETWTWWYDLWKLISDSKQLNINSNFIKNDFKLDSYNKKINCYKILSNIYRELDYESQLKLSEELFLNFNKNSNPNVFMSWSEIKQLAESELMTIGAHTVNHLSLSNISLEKSVFEIEKPKQILEKKIGLPVNHFAFPFGNSKDFSAREEAILEKVGFKSAVSTITTPQKKLNLFSVPRLSIDNSSNIRNIKSKVNGMEQMIRSIY